MFRKLLLVVSSVLLVGAVYAQSSGTIRVRIFDAESKEPVPFANVIVEQDGNQITGGTSDFDGICLIKPVPAGRFTVRASYVGYSKAQINGVLVIADKIIYLDIPLSPESMKLDEVVVVDYKVPLISKDNTQSGGTVTSEEIGKMQGRSADAVAATVGGVYAEDGSVKSVRGAREEATVYYVDGVKVRGTSSVPKSAIEQVSVVTGGLSAKYGDATGGVISIVTKGPSKNLYGSVEMHTSTFLTPYKDHMAAINLSGPLFSLKTVNPSNPEKIVKKPIVGFLLAGEVGTIGEPRPSAVGQYVLKQDYLDSLKRRPFVGFGSANQLAINYFRGDAFEKVDVRKNVGSFKAMATGKLDIKPFESGQFTIGGTFDYNRFRNYVRSFSWANWDNNPLSTNSTQRAYIRFNQRFRTQKGEGEEQTLISNINYTLQFDISTNKSEFGHADYGDDFFKYGYYGKMLIRQVPTYEWGYDANANLNGYLQNAFYAVLDTIYSTPINPLLARYNELFYENIRPYYNQFTQIRPSDLEEGGGYLNGRSPLSLVFNSFGLSSTTNRSIAMPGTIWNSYSKSDNMMIRATGTLSFDIKGHEVSAGFEYEKRTDRGYSVSPIGLWFIARELTNYHIKELDFSQPIPRYLTVNGQVLTDPYGNPIFTDTIDYPRLYSRVNQSQFDINLRSALGLPLDGTNWINVDGIDPGNLSISWFSPDELFANGQEYASFYGYDHTGKKLTSRVTFNDFFTKTYIDQVGNRRYSRLIPAFEPIYMAGYIQDKFAFNDLIFNIGLRVDYFDLNQKVLKDPYLFFETHTVGETYPIQQYGWMYNDQGQIAIPSNVPKGSYIYVNNSSDPTEIVGFRNGRTWYNAEGIVVNSHTAIGEIQPFLVDGDQVGSQSFLNSFKDYKPEIVPMPRISFSFPVSDEALFFAHYDVLTKRPAIGRINYLDYLFIRNQEKQVISNPNTRPEKTIDYELGFQQKVSETSSIKLSAFYREMRDMIQLMSVAGAYPVSYLTYGNLDFGTVKGFTGTYDLRRTGNVSLRTTYTLQFAKGTGSDATTAYNLIIKGFPNLRTIYPLDFDSRHQISVVLDYRYGENKDYNGPKIFGTNILENAGINITLMTNSGTPYSSREKGTNLLVGKLNGNNLPWTTSINVRMDKDFKIGLGSDSEGKTKYGVLNVYLDVSNLLNTLNIASVYSTTGNPDDDGFLTYGTSQPFIEQRPDPQAYREVYAFLINHPGNYRLPRTARIGVQFSF
ncbi:MAG TPA: carboxypeptidase-like regulatory domain-containing protein [Salinivirgaceae bacterium]|nr:carboxypeptidase-like regulatory domain-containing protein [Salinivirgaceae bacterium]